jgi:hypothetical protein
MPTLDREEQEAEEPPREDETKPERERAHVTQGQDEGRQEDEIVEGKEEGGATSVADEALLGARAPLDIPVPPLPPCFIVSAPTRVAKECFIPIPANACVA